MDPDSTVVLFRSLPAQSRLTAKEKNALKNFALQLTSEVTAGRPFTCLITGDTEMRKLNKDFLQHDYPTDVLSFPSEDLGLGELAISVEKAGEQARELRHDRADELRVLMLHGVLHLLGHDHERDRGEMARAERKWRSYFRLPVTLISRTPQAAEVAQ